MPEPRQHRSPLKRQSLSPPAWKAQLRQRCLQRLKQDRGQLLARLRRPDARSVSEEMQQLVAREQQQQREDAAVSVDDLLLMGKLREDDYLEIVHALEDALQEEDSTQDDELLAQHMQEQEDAELEAMLAGMDLEEGTVEDYGDLEDIGAISVLCPICKTSYLREHAPERADTLPYVSCSCDFTFHVTYVYHGVLEDFQDKVVAAFMTHRDSCLSDPTFTKMKSADVDAADVLCIKCVDCGCDRVLR